MKSKEQLAEDYADNVRPIKGLDKHDAPFLTAFEHHEDVMDAFIAGFEAAKNRLTIDELHVGLRMCNIDIHKSILDKLIDVCELIMDKSGDATISDVEELKLKWKSEKQ